MRVSTVGDNFSTVEGIQYIGGYLQYSGGLGSVLLGDNICAVGVIQYSEEKGLKYHKFSKNLEIFSRAYFTSQSGRPHRIHSFLIVFIFTYSTLTP